jgi:hypothetical protein
MTARADHFAKGLLPALLWLGASCAPDLPLRVAPSDGEAPAQEPDPSDGGATPDAPPQACPFKLFPPAGVNVPGDFCSVPEDCAHGPDDFARCEALDLVDVQLKLQRCHRLVRAKLGEECTLTVTSTGAQTGGSSLEQQPLPDVSGFCDLTRELVCDARERRCRALPALGQSCAGHGYCARGATCEGDVCVPGRALGQPCQSVGDFLDQPQCEPTARCDLPTSTCVPARATGEPCDYGPQCASGVCLFMACAPQGTCPP